MENIQDILQRISKGQNTNVNVAEYECSTCRDKGFIEWEEEGYTYSKECECQIRARERERTKRHIEESNLKEVLNKMTFESYKANTKINEAIKKRAIKYLDSDSWWYIGGKVGTGKTHITTAICGELIKRGQGVHYMNWKRDSIRLKTSMTEESYANNLLKGGVTSADKDLLFMIIDARYTRKLKTLISTEKIFTELEQIDEAVASRIKQMTDDEFWIELSKLENYRYKN